MNSLKKVCWYDLYLFGMKLGISCIKAGDIGIGLRSIFNPVRSGFNRYIEAPYAINAMELKKNDSVLDISSPKHVALFVKALYSNNLTSIDIMPDFIEIYKRYESDIGLKDISWEVQDARKLNYENASFDKVYSISVLEHIPDDGDMLTVREIGRILRPGGICSITVPFSTTFKTIYKNSAVYEREFKDEPVFFSRLYDEQAISNRLVIPSGLQEADRIYYRSRFGLETLWDKMPRLVKMSLQWTGPAFSFLGYKKIANLNNGKNDFEGFCCITLIKKQE